MPDTLNLSGGDPNPVDPQVFAQWVQQAQAKLAAGGTLGPNEIPTGYKVEGNQLVQDTELGSSLLKGALGVGLGIAGGYGASALDDLITGASSIAGAGSGIGAAGGGSAAVSAGAGGLSGVVPSAVAGASAGAGAGGVLPSSSTVPNTGALVPSTTSRMSAALPDAAGLPDWLKSARDVGDALSSMSAGRAAGRVAEGTANQSQNRAAVDLYNSELNAPAKIASNAVRGDILSNAHDVHIAAPSTIPVPTISGGLHPDMFSPETRATGVGLRSNALASAANLQPVTAPVLPPLPQAGTLDDLMNGTSIISGLSRAVPNSAWDKIGGFVKGLF